MSFNIHKREIILSKLPQAQTHNGYGMESESKSTTKDHWKEQKKKQIGSVQLN